MVRRKEGTPSTGEFNVVTSGAPTIYRWLTLMDKVQKPPFNESDRESPPLTLGTLEVKDSILTLINSTISYDPDDQVYALETKLLFAPDNQSPVTDVGSLIERLSKSRRIEHFDLEKVEKDLQKESALKGYQIEGEDGTRLVLTNSQTGNSLVLHRINHPYPAVVDGLCFHTGGELPETTDGEFETIYAEQAEVLKQIVRALYGSKNNISPSVNYILEAPKGLDRRMESLEEQLRMHKRALAQSGMIDDDGLAEEIRAKIVLERRPDVSFDDIGGLDRAKEELKTIVQGLKTPEIFERYGTRPPRGVLLAGPPGTGKTLLAKALAHEGEASIYVVNTSDVLHHLYGKTERLIQAIFDEARKDGPVIIFIDEIDALASHRNYSTEVTSRIVSVLLTNMDGLEETKDNIIVVGATNRLEAIDPALRRPKRFDLLVEVDLPDVKEREDIFKIHMAAAMKRAGRENLFGEIDLEQVTVLTNGFSGADIQELIRRVLVDKVKQDIEGQNPGPVSTEDIERTIKNFEETRSLKEKATGQYL